MSTSARINSQTDLPSQLNKEEGTRGERGRLLKGLDGEVVYVDPDGTTPVRRVVLSVGVIVERRGERKGAQSMG